MDRKDLLVNAKLLGYEKVPVSIREFVTNKYYLGNVYGGGSLYPYWLEALEKVFPTPIHIAYPIVVQTGAIGTGKSTFSKIAALYEYYKLSCLKDPWKSCGVAKGKTFKFSFQHRTADLANTDFINSIQTIMQESPFFSNGTGREEDVIFSAEGERGNKTIGSDTIFYVLSELNFLSPDKAEYKLDQAFKRWDSRFFPVKGFFGLIIIDSSALGDNSVTDKFIKDCPYPDLLVMRTSIWQAKKHLNIYGLKGWFKVYAGDSTNPPFIVDDDHKVTDEMDPSRVLDVPEELRGHFISNIESSLQDIAGYSTTIGGTFIEDPRVVKERMTLPMYSSEVIKVDFYNKRDKLWYQLSRYFSKIPDGKKLYVRYDIGLVNDKCGIAVTYFDRFNLIPGSPIKIPIYVTPLMVALSRYQEQETSIYHLHDFVLDIKQRFEIGEFSTDQFASAQLLQDLTREGFNCTRISVDRTETPYLYWKSQLLAGTWTGCSNKLAMQEACELRRLDRKIDHPKEFSDGSVGSKDIMDAVAGSVWSCYQNLEEACQFTTKELVQEGTKFLDKPKRVDSDLMSELSNF